MNCVGKCFVRTARDGSFCPGRDGMMTFPPRKRAGRDRSCPPSPNKNRMEKDCSPVARSTIRREKNAFTSPKTTRRDGNSRLLRFFVRLFLAASPGIQETAVPHTFFGVKIYPSCGLLAECASSLKGLSVSRTHPLIHV